MMMMMMTENGDQEVLCGAKLGYEKKCKIVTGYKYGINK